MAASTGTFPRNISREPDEGLVFSPSPRLRAFHLLILVLVTWLILLPLLILVTLSSPVHITLIVAFILLVILLAIRWYIPRYWASFQVRFTGTGMICERGAWRKNRASVPYSRIRGLDIECGVVCRHLRIAALRIVLDDRSFVRLPGVEEPEETRKFLKSFINDRK